MANRQATDLGRALTEAERKARLRRLAAENGQATSEAVNAAVVRVVMDACASPGAGVVTLAEIVRHVVAMFPAAERERVLSRFSLPAASP